MSVSLQTRKGIAISSDSAGVVKTWDISTGLCKASFQTPATGDFRDVQLIEGRFILVWHAEEKIHILVWDTEKSDFKTIDMSEVHGLRISGDGSNIFCLTSESIQLWSTWTGKPVGKVEVDHLGLSLDSLYVDGSRIWVYSIFSSNTGWDFGILGSSPTPLSNTFPDRPHLNFILGNKWTGSTSGIEDTITGKEIFQLIGRYARPFCAQWDGQYLVAGFGSGEVLILDFGCVTSQ
jgi:hypothetical protein